jgi:hypothetical protein
MSQGETVKEASCVNTDETSATVAVRGEVRVARVPCPRLCVGMRATCPSATSERHPAPGAVLIGQGRPSEIQGTSERPAMPTQSRGHGTQHR